MFSFIHIHVDILKGRIISDLVAPKVHVCQVFWVFLSYCLCVQMPLEITRSFIQNQDGTYELFKCPKVEVESIAETYGRIEKQPVLRPLELKTFLKVGK